MTSLKQITIKEFVKQKNDKKKLFTAGPAALLEENITGLRPCFGRGDKDYLDVEKVVLENLLKISGHKHIARLQGSASLALEIASFNYLSGKILIIKTGYYSERLKLIAENISKLTQNISQIDEVEWNSLDNIRGNYDWLVACVTETSAGILLPIKDSANLAKKINARLMLDATASIGLENNHDYADVIAYSSCKGLFGLTGGSFIAFNEKPTIDVDSFYLNLNTHMNKGVTGPYHTIASLYEVLPNHEKFAFAVKKNKQVFLEKFNNYLSQPKENQPQLCTHLNSIIISDNSDAILYTPRNNLGGSVVCHLGEVNLATSSKGKIIDNLKIIK